MKNTLKNLLPLVSILLSIPSIAQNEFRDLNGVYYVPSFYTNQFQIEEGSPYLTKKFVPSRINGSKKTYLTRINGHNGTAEVWINENKVIELSNETKNQISFLDGSDREYESMIYRNPKGARKHAYFQIALKNESYGLYMMERVKYFKKQKAEGYQKAKPARFEKVKPHFYLQAGTDQEKPLVYLPTSPSKFAQVFSKGRQKAVKGFIKKEKLNLQAQEDLVKVLNFVYKP